jgi:hypothetical protein
MRRSSEIGPLLQDQDPKLGMDSEGTRSLAGEVLSSEGDQEAKEGEKTPELQPFQTSLLKEDIHLNESIELQDLLFLTDFYGIPDLSRMVCEAEVSQGEIEFHMLS